MISIDTFSSQLRHAGFRMTKVRLAILKFLIDQHCALSAQDMLALLSKQRLKPNISTIYRELQFLTVRDIAQEVVFKDGVIRYELREGAHHHHLVCNACDTVEPIEMEKHLEAVEKSIHQNQKFRVLSHSLEFYGICAGCH